MDRELPDFKEIEALKEKPDFEGLADVLRYREDSDLRAAAMKALCEIDPERAADVILEFASDKNWKVSRVAVELLAELGDLRCLPFIDRLKGSFERFERERAVELLRAINKPEAVGMLLDLLDDPDEEVWDAAHDAILEMGEIAVPALIEAMDRFTDAHNAAELLADLMDERAMEPLVEKLRSSDGIDRYYAIRALRFFSTPEIIESMAPAVSDGRADTRKEAVMYLARQEGDRAAELLAVALGDEHQEVRLEAARSLADKGDPKAIEVLEALLDAPDSEIRSKVIAALAQASGPGSIAAIEKSLSDEDKYVRHAAVRALGTIGTPEAIRLLLLATEDPYELVSNGALRSLRAIGRSKVEEAIASLPDADDLRERAKGLL